MVQYLIKIDADGRAAIAQAAATGDAIEKLDRRASVAESGIRRMVGAFAGLVGVRALLSQVTTTLNQFGRVADEARRAGVDVEKFQELSLALRNSGVEPSAIFAARRTLATAQTDALQNQSGDAAKAFRAVGITPAQLQTQNSERLIETIARLVPGLPTEGPAGSATLANLRTLLGREGDALAGVFRDGFLDQVTQIRGRRLGLSAKEVERLDTMGDELGMAGQRLRSGFGRALASRAEMLANPSDEHGLLMDSILANVVKIVAGRGRLSREFVESSVFAQAGRALSGQQLNPHFARDSFLFGREQAAKQDAMIRELEKLNRQIETKL